MGGINWGIAAGSFEQTADIKDLYQNFIKARTAAQVRQLQQIKPGTVVGGAPGTTTDPTKALLAAGVPQAQIPKLLGQGADAVNAALDKLPNKGGVSSGVTFYKDPTTGQLGATTAPLKADNLYIQSHVAALYVASGDPQLVAQGNQMAASVQQQRASEIQIQNAQRAQDLQGATLMIQAGNSEGAAKLLTQRWSQDFGGMNNLGVNTTFNYDPNTQTFVKQDLNVRGQPIGSPTPIPLQDSADGKTPGMTSYLMAATSPEMFAQMQQQHIQQTHYAAADANGAIEAKAAQAQAVAAQTGASAEVLREKDQVELLPGQIAAQEAEANRANQQAGVFSSVAQSDTATAQTNTAVSQAIVKATNQNIPYADRLAAIRQLSVAGKLPPGLSATSPVPNHPDEMFVNDINGIPAAIQTTTNGQVNLTPIGNYASALGTPQAQAAGASIGLLPGGFAGVRDNYGHFGMTGDPTQDTMSLYQAGVANKAFKPVGTGFFSRQPIGTGVNAIVPGAQPSPTLTGPPQVSFSPPVRVGGMQLGLSAAATGGQSGTAAPGTAQLYGQGGPAGFGSNTGMGNGLAGGQPPNPAMFGQGGQSGLTQAVNDASVYQLGN